MNRQSRRTFLRKPHPSIIRGLRRAAFGLMLVSAPLSAQNVTTDLSQGASFHFKIAPSLPEFTFKVIPAGQEKDQYVNAQSTVRDIEVYQGESKQPVQHLTGCAWEDMEPPYRDADWIRAEDVNFDGYKDIYVMTTWGATGNEFGCVWLYNPSAGRFEYSKEFSELPRFWTDAAKKTIFTFDKGGAAGQVHDANKYKVEDNKLVLVWHEHQDWDFDKKEFHCVIEERKGSGMETTKDEWSRPAAQWGDAVAPCDPAALFEGSRN